nr:hypothetical protein [uncultured Dethiosulfovibrio sp.]
MVYIFTGKVAVAVQDHSIRLEDHFLDVLSVEIANYERIAHLFEDAEDARFALDPMLVDSRKLTRSFIRQKKVPVGGRGPYVVFCRRRGRGEPGESFSDSVQQWYGEELIIRAIKKITDRGFYSRLQVEEIVESIGSSGWVPAGVESGNLDG